MTGLRSRLSLVLLSLGAIVTLETGFAPHSHANPLPANCSVAPWGFLGSKTREICDGPVQSDGSWMRTRLIGVPAHYVNPSESCSGGQYYSNCAFYPGGYVSDQYSDNETYPVRPDNVLPDEPPHLGG
jgi:hypothetical protein